MTFDEAQTAMRNDRKVRRLGMPAGDYVKAEGLTLVMCRCRPRMIDYYRWFPNDDDRLAADWQTYSTAAQGTPA